MNPPTRWAILGPGRIADKFADAFKSTPQANLYAIASRDAARGKEFARKFNVPVIHASYEALVKDPKVDIIYVATPHPFHHAQSLLCLKHQKAVLCEKPLTMSHRETLELVNAAKANNTFLMEGMWSRFFPATVKATELINAGAIGAVRFLKADFGFLAPFDPTSRVYDLRLGGGAQLDVGVYPMFLALHLLGKPEKIQALARLAATGADETTTAQFCFSNGAMAHILSSVSADTPKQADIIGSLGTITLHAPWHKSQAVTLRRNDGATEHFDFPYSGLGFEFQLQHVTECMQRGLKESSMMPLDLSLLMAETADEILRQCKVAYPAPNL